MTNTEREERAWSTLRHFRSHRFSAPQPSDESDVRDLLADLMHYSDTHGLDFENEVRVARDNYAAELNS